MPPEDVEDKEVVVNVDEEEDFDKKATALDISFCQMASDIPKTWAVTGYCES